MHFWTRPVSGPLTVFSLLCFVAFAAMQGQGSERGSSLCADLIVTVLLLEGISGASYYEGSFSNIRRAADGSYVAVSSRGNFFLTWSPGQSNWQPHNRPQ